ncbi:myc box-dependent-interacting protein 1b isoform X2 [Gadus chalcogrammus]|uniref:myc box-dependent-interacting protein 1b isoform X2 n=1 Tax=Gadus chalcogrammus TaxID=1042646 RepID=UPI0024C242B9|nr:myc box-dependent-interacting protein 1b isoform X2 [Gadus chalcogrammus]
MAEIGKGVTAGKLAINVQKKFTRAQEKVLQKLGKADETRDAAFEETVGSFNKQMVEGAKLQKDLKAYLLAVKTMHDASRRLQECLAEMYDPEWFGKEEVDSMVEDTDANWTDYYEKLTDESLLSLDTYLSQFPDIKARLAKRERKMVDFDSARHHFASIQKGKKKDEAKIAKPAALLEMAAPLWAQGLLSAHQVAQTHLSKNQAEEELGRAQKVFEELNVELQDELPVLWDSRVGVYVNTFQNLASNQEKFHRDMGKLSQNLNDVMTKLDEQRLDKKNGSASVKPEEASSSEGANHSVAGDSQPAKRLCPPPSRPPARMSLTPSPGPEDDESPETAPTSTTSVTSTSPMSTAQQEQPSMAPPEPHTPVADPAPQGSHGDWGTAGGGGGGGDGGGVAPDDGADYTESLEGPRDEDSSDERRSLDLRSLDQRSLDQRSLDKPGHEEDWGAQEDCGGERGDQTAVTNGDGDLPEGFLYKVKVLHDYAATDGDELELKTGDMVLVMAFDSPDEQDDGWLVGVKESHWLQHKDISIKGVFPENFTQKV